MLKVQNLCFSYYKKPLCLKDINLEIKKGEKSLVIASREMGKTTFLKVVSSFETHYFGKILLDNKNLKDIDDKDKNFSLILSKPVFIENKTIKQNFDYFCEINNRQYFSEEEIIKFLNELGIKKSISVKIKNLSLFEKRKLAIKRALLKKPTILFLDDQFSGLNLNEQKEMTEIYQNLLENKSQTIIFTLGECGCMLFKDVEDKKFNNIFYLCDAVIKKYSSIKEFLEKKDNADVFNFLDGYKSFSVKLIINDNKIMLEYDNEVCELDKSLLIDKNKNEDEECLLFAKTDEVKQISSKILVKKLTENEANLYAVLGGDKLI